MKMHPPPFQARLLLRSIAVLVICLFSAAVTTTSPLAAPLPAGSQRSVSLPGVTTGSKARRIFAAIRENRPPSVSRGQQDAALRAANPLPHDTGGTLTSVGYRTQGKRLREEGEPGQVLFWLQWGLGLSAFGVIVFLVATLLLQRQIHNKMTELDFQNKRLEAEIERHKRTQETLHLHTAALETTATAVMIVDTAGTIVWVNTAYTRLTGYTKQESIGKTHHLLKPKPTSPLLRPSDEMLHAVRTGKEWHGEITNLHKDGRLYTVEITLMPITNKEGNVTHFVATLQDVTERKMQEYIRGTRLTISRSLEGMDTLRSVGETIVALTQETFQAQTTALSLYTEEGHERVLFATGKWQRYIGGRAPSAWPRPIAGDAILHSMAKAQEITGIPFFAVLRLETHQEHVGYLWVGKQTPFSAADEKLLVEVHPTLAFALQRAALLKSLRDSLQRINALNAVALAIASSVDLHLTANILLDELMSQADIQATALSVYHPEGHAIETVQARNLPAGIPRRARNVLSSPYLSSVVRGQRPLVIPDLRKATQPGDASARLLSQMFRGYGCFPLIAKGKINGILEVYSASILQAEGAWFEFTRLLSRQAAIGIENATLFDSLQRNKDELTVSYESALLGWSRAMAIRHHEPPEHAERVANLCLRMAQRLGLQDEADLRAARHGAWLHDIGKLGIPEEILLQNKPFTREDCARYCKALSSVKSFLANIPLLEGATTIPTYRYEQWDGNGCPEGLRGEEIPLLARIFAVVHFWDARSEPRHYMPAMSREERIAYLQAQAGTRFDPHVVKIFLESDLV